MDVFSADIRTICFRCAHIWKLKESLSCSCGDTSDLLLFLSVGHENRDALERILRGSKGEPLLAHRQWSRDILRWHINDSKGFTFYHKRGPDVRWVNHSEQADTNKDNGAGRGQGPLLCVWESGITIPWMLFLFKKLMMRVDCECSSRLSPLIFFLSSSSSSLPFHRLL